MNKLAAVTLLCFTLLLAADSLDVSTADRPWWVPVRFKNLWDYHRPSAKDWALNMWRDSIFDDMLADMAPYVPDSMMPKGSRGIATDFVEKDSSFEIKADLPGVPKDAIKVDVEGDVLGISVERSEECDTEEDKAGVKVHRIERTSRYQKRSIRLPESAVMSQVHAAYVDGVLTVTVPKSEVRPAEGAKRIDVV